MLRSFQGVFHRLHCHPHHPSPFHPPVQIDSARRCFKLGFPHAQASKSGGLRWIFFVAAGNRGCLEDHPRTCKWLVSPIYKQPIWKGNNPILRGLTKTMVINHLLNGMILQVVETNSTRIRNAFLVWWLSFNPFEHDAQVKMGIISPRSRGEHEKIFELPP